MPSSERSFAQRADPATLPEWMDQPCSYEDFRSCLLDLGKANRLLFAHRPVLAWLSELPHTESPLRIVDVGSGGGDLLRAIASWAAQNRIAVRLTGVDTNPMSTRAASEFSAAHPQIQWLTMRAEDLPANEPIDVITCSLCTHHMRDEDIVELLRWMDRTAIRGWFINDLRRSRLNYALFALLSRAARWHPFVQHDGPVSIARSFREQDWKNLCRAAGIDSTQIARRLVGRLCVSKTHA